MTAGFRPVGRSIAVLCLLVVALAEGRAASRAPVHARHGMVAASEERAARAGVEILKQGGNAIDAAVATGFALAVTHPVAGNLGGGGFMVIHLAGSRETTIDYREVAPGRATRDMYLDRAGQVIPDASTIGHLASGVPGSVAGMAYAQEKFGRLTLAQVVAPAIALAEDGFPVSEHLARSIEADRGLLGRFPESARIFLIDGHAPPPGATLVQKDLAATLRAIAEGGPDAFYRGHIADLIADEMSRGGGLMNRADLAAYAPIEREPVRGRYRGYDIESMGPSSSGGVGLIEMLNVIEGWPVTDWGAGSSRTIHAITETMKRAYADRAEWLGDPAFFRVPTAGLLSKTYAGRIRVGIDLGHATPSAEIKAGAPQSFESQQTTHYSVVDEEGNAVATTTTLNGGYGSGVVVKGAGFLLNNEMDDFSVKPGVPNMYGLIGGEANAIAPGKRMLSSMTPTILLKDGRPYLVLGTPGGSRIITTVLQVVTNVVDFGMNVQEAVDAPRFHHQWFPDELRLERLGFAADVVDALKARGHNVVVANGTWCDVQAILIDPKTGERYGASDPRADGRPVGY